VKVEHADVSVRNAGAGLEERTAPKMKLERRYMSELQKLWYQG
jgi:hypothetical protein